MQPTWYGKTVLVTGAGRGLGKRFAIGFAKLGARVALLSRSKGELDAARLEIEHSGGNALRIIADVRDHEHMVTAVERIGVHFGNIDIAICAAGILGPIGPFLDNPIDLWRETIETNVIGVVNSCRAVLPQMRERRQGKVIIIAGPGAEAGRPNFSAYATAKTAICRFTESIALELLESNVQVNCFHPGGAYTSATDEILHAGERAGWKEIEAAQQIRVNGGPSPERQMEFLQFLASEESNHLTGMFLTVNDDLRKLHTLDAKTPTNVLRRSQKT